MDPIIEARFSVIERRLRDLEIALELELPPMDEDPRTKEHPPDTSQRFAKEVDPKGF